MKFAKYVLPVVIGASTSMLLIMLGEKILSILFPAAPGAATELTNAPGPFSTVPQEIFELLIVNYAIASFAGGLVATFIGKREWLIPVWIIGFLLTLGGLMNVISFPQPLWFSVINLFVYIPFCYLGYRVARKKTIQVAS